MAVTPNWQNLIKKEIGELNPVVSKLSQEMANFDKRLEIVDRVTNKYVSTINSLTKSFSGLGIISNTIIKGYEGYLNTIDKLSRSSQVYGSNVKDLEKRIESLTKKTNLSKIELSEMQELADRGLLGPRSATQIDSVITRINKFAANAKQAKEIFSDLVEIQGKFGTKLGSLKGLSATEVAGLSRNQFMSAIQTQFMGGGGMGGNNQLRSFQRYRQDYENRILQQGQTLAPTGFAVAGGMKGVGNKLFGQNQEGLVGSSAFMGAGSSALGMLGPLLQFGAYHDIRKRLGGGRGPSSSAGGGGGFGGGGLPLVSSMTGGGGGSAVPVYVMNKTFGGATPFTGSRGSSPVSSAPIGAQLGGMGAGRMALGLGGMALMNAGLFAVNHYAPDISKGLAGGDKMTAGIQGATKWAAPGLNIAAMGAMSLNPWMAGGGLIAAGLGGAYGAYKGVQGANAKSAEGEADTVKKKRMLELENQINGELKQTELNEKKITGLISQYNKLVKDTKDQYNANVVIIGTMYDRLQQTLKLQERSVGLVADIASSYGTLSDIYGSQLLMGKEAEDSIRTQIQYSLEKVKIERKNYEDAFRLNDELNKKIKEGDSSQLEAQEKLQAAFEKEHGFTISSLDAKAKLMSFYTQERDLQIKNMNLAGKTAEIQGDVQAIYVKQAEAQERLSTAARVAIGPQFATILNTAKQLEKQINIQREGYMAIGEELQKVNSEIANMSSKGIHSQDDQSKLQDKIAEKRRLGLKLAEQETRILDSQSTVMEKLLSLRQSYVESLPEIGFASFGGYEASFDISKEQGGPLFMNPNMFVGGVMGGGMREASAGVSPMGGMGSAGRPGAGAYGQFGPYGPNALAFGPPVAAGAGQRAFGAPTAYHSGGEVAPGLPKGTEVMARLQAGEYVIPAFAKGGPGVPLGELGTHWTRAGSATVEEVMKEFGVSEKQALNLIKNYPGKTVHLLRPIVDNYNLALRKLEIEAEREASRTLPYKFGRGVGKFGRGIGSKLTENEYIKATGKLGRSIGKFGGKGLKFAGRIAPFAGGAVSGVGTYHDYKRMGYSETESMTAGIGSGLGYGALMMMGGPTAAAAIGVGLALEYGPDYYANWSVGKGQGTSEEAMNAARDKWLNARKSQAFIGGGAPTYNKADTPYIEAFNKYNTHASWAAGTERDQQAFKNYIDTRQTNLTNSIELDTAARMKRLRGFASGGKTLPGPTGGFIAELHPNEVVLNQGQIARMGLGSSDFSKAGVPGFGGGGFTGGGGGGGGSNVHVTLDDSGSLKAVVSTNKSMNSFTSPYSYIHPASSFDGGNGV